MSGFLRQGSRRRAHEVVLFPDMGSSTHLLTQVPIHLLTWNLDGLNTKRLDQRTERACMQILLGGSLRQAVDGHKMRPVPEIVCLQEVVRRSYLGHLRKHFAAAGFEIYPHEVPDREIFEVIAVRAPWAVVSFEQVEFADSPLGRRLSTARLRRDEGVEIVVCTGHLESLRSGSESRINQVLEIDERFRALGLPSLFAGDTNLRASEWREASKTAQLSDVADRWDTKLGGTWFADEERTRGYRFDRVFVDGQRALTVDQYDHRHHPKISDHAAVDLRLTL